MDHIDKTWIDLDIDIDTNVVNIKSVSVRWCLHVFFSKLFFMFQNEFRTLNITVA